MGPASSDEKIVRGMIFAGMNVARFNFSHGSHEEHKARMEMVRSVSKNVGIPVALMLDTKGPEIRTGLVAESGDAKGGKTGGNTDGKNGGKNGAKNDEKKPGNEGSGLVEFKCGQLVRIDSAGGFTRPAKGKGDNREDAAYISLSLKDIAERVKEGVRILIADGLFELDVLETDGKTVLCRAVNNAKIGSRKNVNLIGINTGLPVIGEQDKSDIAFGATQDIDFISASFLSFPHEVAEIHEFSRSVKCNARVIAKIESRQGLENIDKIAAVTDGIMVARGDLALQIPDEQIPLAQKRIVEAGRAHCKPVIVATQMLDSMIVNPRPTRAELTDVANAIFDGADAVMLSGETANGSYPVETIETMAKICATVEQSDEFKRSIRDTIHRFYSLPASHDTHVPSEDEISKIISRQTYETALNLNAKMIVTPTNSGKTPQYISVFRPEQPILAPTPSEQTLRSQLLVWGVFPQIAVRAFESEEMIQNALKLCSESGVVKMSDRIVLTAALRLHSSMINTIRVLIIGNVLARGTDGHFSNPKITRASGKIVYADSPNDAREILKLKGGEILVCPTLTNDYIPILRIVGGVIAEGGNKIKDEILKMINPNLVWLTGLRNASRKLENGLSVTIDGSDCIVYEGTI